MLVVAALALQAAAVRAQEVGVPAEPIDGYPRRTGVDVLHYDLALELPATGRRIAGRTGILFEVRATALDSLALDFGPLTVDSVRVDGAAAAFRHADGRLVVALAPERAAGARSRAVVWYHGEPADGLIFKENLHGEPVVFADNWAVRGRLWFPAIDHPSDKARVSFEVTAPAAFDVVANGTPRAVLDLGDGRRRTRWDETAEIPTYGMVIGVSEFAVEEAGTAAGVPVSHWTYRPDSAAGSIAFARTVEILAFFDSLIGPYPYEKLAHVQSATRFGGMENPSAIFYAEESVAAAATRDDPAAVDDWTELVAHETAHQWFGDAVTEADWHHLWLSEGFADYFAAVFFERQGSATGRGPAELARWMVLLAEEVFAYDAGGGGPIVDPAAPDGDYLQLLTPANYEKGAWVLHMLRHELGDESFFAGIRDYYATFRDGVAWSSDFERTMELASGRDLGWFFAQWLGRPGHPVLEVETTPAAGGGTRVTVRQVQPEDPWRLTVDLALTGPGGERRERIELTGREAEVVVDDPVSGVTLDPDGWLLHRRAATRTGGH